MSDGQVSPPSSFESILADREISGLMIRDDMRNLGLGDVGAPAPPPTPTTPEASRPRPPKDAHIVAASTEKLPANPIGTSANASASADKCPVDHSVRTKWLSTAPTDHPFHPTTPSTSPPASSSRPPRLSEDRVTSSIPRSATSPLAPSQQINSDSPANSDTPIASTSTDPSGGEDKWVYPSEQQFFAAMQRKKHNPRSGDMKTIVPIHNAVNEKAWEEVLAWEGGMGGEKCGGPRMISFAGRPKDRTPKAWINTALGYVDLTPHSRDQGRGREGERERGEEEKRGRGGEEERRTRGGQEGRSRRVARLMWHRYTPPFDRHDWLIDRCGTRVRYVIDFYTGKADAVRQGNMAFYLDVRPAVDDWEGVRTRVMGWWNQWRR
jgi:cytochrome c heme-lyase